MLGLFSKQLKVIILIEAVTFVFTLLLDPNCKTLKGIQTRNVFLLLNSKHQLLVIFSDDMLTRVQPVSVSEW